MNVAGRGEVGANVPAGGALCALRRLVAVGALLLAVTGCAEDGTVTLEGEHIEVVAVWQDAEAVAFEQVLDAFEAATGATVRFTSTEGADLATVLDERLAAGDPPDLAVVPQPGLIARYARDGAILPIGAIVGDRVEDSYATVWERLGTVDGELYGVWFKAADKSLVWYSIGAFERAGVVPPGDLARFAEVARTLARSGIVAFSVPDSPSDGWTYTDLFENLYLRLAGAERYDALALHRLPWTDPSVVSALVAMAQLVSPADLAASPPGSTFAEAVGVVFSTTPGAAMVAEGDFVPGVAPRDEAEVGVDVDVFAFPEPDPSARYVVGGGDAAVLMRSSEAAEELLRFLASPAAAEVWAPLGGFVSPNEDVDLTAYPDGVTRRIARAVLEAGDEFRFDLSDLQPVELGGTRDSALWTELRAFVADPSDPLGTAQRLEAAADEAWADEAVTTGG